MTSYLELDSRIGPEHEAMKQAVHEFARVVLRAAALELDRLADRAHVIAPESALWTTLRAAYAQGFHAALVPTALGGMGLSGLALHVALEELGWGSADFAVSLAVTSFPFTAAAASGDAGLVQEFLMPFVKDREARFVGCWAITEPDHGSDHFLAAGPQFHDSSLHASVTARRDGDHWVIDGEKARWVSNGSIATHAVVYLSLDPGLGMAGGGIALVPLDLPGVARGAPLDKMGQRGLNQGAIAFHEVRIPARFMLLAEPREYAGALGRTLSMTGAAMGAIFTGVARAAFEEALDYSRTRLQGGRPLCEHQLVQKHLYDMFVRVEASRALSRAALIYNQSGAPVAPEYAAAAKTYCTQAAYEVTDIAMSLLGGYGLTKGPLVEKLFRDARAGLVEDGANDVLALAAAHQILVRHAGERASTGT